MFKARLEGRTQMSEVREERRYCETPTVVPLHDAQSDEVRATDESPNEFYLYELSLRWISQPSPSYKQAARRSYPLQKLARCPGSIC